MQCLWTVLMLWRPKSSLEKITCFSLRNWMWIWDQMLLEAAFIHLNSFDFSCWNIRRSFLFYTSLILNYYALCVTWTTYSIYVPLREITFKHYICRLFVFFPLCYFVCYKHISKMVRVWKNVCHKYLYIYNTFNVSNFKSRVDKILLL